MAIPFLGTLVTLAAVVFGLGAIGLGLNKMYQTARTKKVGSKK